MSEDEQWELLRERLRNSWVWQQGVDQGESYQNVELDEVFGVMMHAGFGIVGPPEPEEDQDRG